MNKKERAYSFRDLMIGMRSVIKNALLYKREFFTSVFLALVLAALDPFNAVLIGKFIDSLGNTTYVTLWSGHSIPLYIGILIIWACVMITNTIVQRFGTVSNLKVGEYVRRGFILRISEHLFRLPISFHKSTKSGETHEKINNAANAVTSILENIIVILPQTFSILIFLVIVFNLNAKLFIFILCIIIIFIGVTSFMGRGMATLQKKSIRIYQRIRGGVVDAVTNVRIIKDFGTEAYQTELVRKGYYDEAIPFYLHYMGIKRNQNLAQNILIICTRLVILISSISLVHSGSWTIGDLVIANTYIGTIFNPIIALSNNWRDIQNGVITIQEVDEIFALPVEAYTHTTNYKAKLRGDIEFENVSFGYGSDRTVLHDISFKAHPGEIIALVGESGVGKSSLIDLISAYHAPNSGRILIDGKLITEVPLEQLRHNIAVVTQELTLFNDTIKNNLRYGNFERTDAEIATAAHKAHCLDFIEKFPEKWDQMVGERGLKLSVGQKQRVAIARAILKDPQILILDEPTSALDAGSEKIITEALDELMQGKTTFVVAHRLSTVRRADTILVFKEGRIIESGKHDELLRIKDGEYRRLYELQIGLHS